MKRVPWPLVPLAGIGAALVVLPLVGLMLRAPWSRLVAESTSPAAREALRLSLVCSVLAAVLCIAVGVPLAFLFARVHFPGRTLMRALILLPLVLPPVVGGVALLMAFGRRGFAGRVLDGLFGVSLPFTTTGAVMAEAFVALPFLVITVEAGLRSSDERYEAAAVTLGAGPWTTFRRVTLPLIRPSLVAGAVLAWARALGEFGATIAFAGNLGGHTRTLPLAVYTALEHDPDAALALSVLLVGVSLAALLPLRRQWGGAR